MFQMLIVVIYLAFIGLGLPDSLLGSVWPIMHLQLQVPLSYAGVLSFMISGETILSGLLSEYVHKKFGDAKVTLVSVALTCVGLFGFGISSRFWMLCLFAIPYGLGTGSVDAVLNNYVATHYGSKHMNWLHCMWGVGASLGPYIMSFALVRGMGWQGGYRLVALLQAVLVFVLFLSLPLWKNGTAEEEQTKRVFSFRELLACRGMKEIMLCFFLYCAMEKTVGLWASSYLIRVKGISETVAASFVSFYFMGITFGRLGSGFLAEKIRGKNLVRLGLGMIACGLFLFGLPLGEGIAGSGLVIAGLGSAPIYPCLVHEVPAFFGKEKSQGVIGMIMAAANTGFCIMPPLFGFLAGSLSIHLFLVYNVLICLGMIFFRESLLRKLRRKDI